jgi:hypothetical protein
MNDLEWYLDVGGKQSGPHTAKEIVELVRSGKIPSTSHVTAARMSGDWVAAQDLVDAYDELYAKKAAPLPMDGAVPFSSPNAPAGSGDPNFRPPPRPTEQLEASKIINLNREPDDRTPDPTDALFQAIQAVREKAAQKAATPSASSSTAPSGGTREHWGQNSRPARPRIPPQLFLIGTLALIFGITVYGISALLGRKAENIEATAPKPTPAPTRSTAPTSPNTSMGRLLNEGGGTNSSRNSLPNRPAAGRAAPTERLEPGGGARYQDDRDAPVPGDRPNPALGAGIPVRPGEERDVDEVEEDPADRGGGAPPNPVPVDPAQVSPDRILPDPDAGGMPGSQQGGQFENGSEP